MAPGIGSPAGVVAVRDVSLCLHRGQTLGLVGESGCGKSTYLRCFNRMNDLIPVARVEGRVMYGGKDLYEPDVDAVEVRRRIGMVFQNYALFPNINIIGNVQYGINRRQFSKSEREQRAMEMLELVGIEEQSYKYPAQLSGGQQQRVALARALAPSPTILLLDEPLSALDARVRVYLRAEIRRIQETLGVTTLMVTHDQEEALTMSDRIVLLKDGRVEQGNFDDYPLARIAIVPSLFETHILNHDDVPTGVGEIGIPSAAPALTNAIFAASGQRIRNLPILDQLSAGEQMDMTSAASKQL